MKVVSELVPESQCIKLLPLGIYISGAGCLLGFFLIYIFFSINLIWFVGKLAVIPLPKQA
jgi:hypothetical protein